MSIQKHDNYERVKELASLLLVIAADKDPKRLEGVSYELLSIARQELGCEAPGVIEEAIGDE